MDATQQIEDSFFREEDDSDDEHELGEGKRQREPLAILKVFKNNHIPETEVPLYLGENVLGRDPTSCSVPLQARSVSGRHAVISISVFGPNDRHAHSEATEALLWDLGSLNGTRKGRLKLTPHVRYALTEGDSVVLADLPCQYVSLKNTERNTHTATADGGREKATGPTSTSGSSEGGTGKGVENGGKKSALPPVPVWTDEAKSLQSLQTTPRKPERTLVPESDSDSDGEKHGRRERRKIVASDSASSDLSSPTCSTFLTPANKVIPESEDESSITPSSALKGRFLKTGNDTEVSSDSSKPDPLHFNIDSDTDVEDEEVEITKATSGIEAAVTAAVDAVNPADLHMDSDTDVEEEEMEKAKSDPEASAAPVKQDSVNPAVTMDSNTDVEENEPVKTDITGLSGPEADLEKKKEPARSSLESDVEDEDVPQDSKPPTSHIAEFNMNSDTDVEEDEDTTKAIEPPSGSEADSKDLGKQAQSVDSNKVPDAKMLHHQSDSDTDVEDDITEIRTPTVAKVTGNSQTRSEIQTADERRTDARHDSPVRVQPPAETVRDEFRLDSDTDVEEDEEKMEEKEQKCAEAAVQIVHSSTPRGAGLSEEEMETEAFLSPSQLFKRPILPSLLHPSVSPGGISHTDDDFTVAETQSFVCDAAQADATLDETPQSLDSPEPRRSDGASSFQLGISDGSHQLPEDEEHDQEPAEEDWQLQATQLYAMKNSEGNTKAGQTQQDLDATQAYTDLMGQEEEEDGRKEEEEEETQPLAALGHSSIHTAETRLIKHRAQNEDNSDHDTNEEVVASEPERKAKEDVNDEMQVDSHLSTADTLLLVRSPRQEEHTQPYAFLSAQIQNEQEETEKEEHESRDQGVQETDEGERAQNEMKESVEQENDDDEEEEEEEGRQIKEMVIEKKNEVTRDGPEEEKKEGDENKRVENDNEVDEARTQPAEADIIVETLPMCEEQEEQLNEPSSSRETQPAKVESTQPLEPDLHARDALAQTLPMCEEEEGQEEEQLNEPNSSRETQPAKVESTQPLEPDVHARDALAQTLPMCEEEEGQEEEQPNEPNSSRETQPAKVESTQPLEPDLHARDALAQTLPMCEEEEGQEEDQPNEPNSSRETQPAKVESTQPLEPDVHARDALAQTLPMCEEEEEQEEEENKPKNSRRPSRRRQTAKAEPKLPVESDKVTHVTIAETQPMCEEDKEEQEEEQQSEAMSTKRASMRRHNTKAKPAKPVTSPVAIPETLPMCEKEEEKPQKPGRKSRRGRQTAKIEPTQPLEPESTAETMKTEEEEEEQDTRRSLRGKERGRAASGKGKGRGRAATEKGKRGKVEQEEDSEEEVDGGNKGRGRKDLRQKSKDDDKAVLELVEAENEEIEHLKTQEDEESKRLQREKKEEGARDRLERERKEREERTRLTKEREEREECEKREQEEKDRVERERIEREKKEREENEMKEREEVKRFEREKQLEKEKREQEEKDRLEQERIERENKEKEEKEKLEKEMRERQELEEKLEKERKKEEEKDRLAREKRDREEKVQLEKEMREEKEKQEKEMEQKEKEKESKDNNEGVEKEKRQAPGKQKKGLGRKGKKSKKDEEQELEEGTKERLETEQELSKLQKQECEEAGSKKQEDEQADSDAKPRRSRRTTRKSVAPPAGVEDEGGPAKRTRSRSNSSNSVCSEQSTQDSLNEGRRRGGRRKTAEEVNERGRPSGRKTTTTAPSSEKEDIKQATPSRSNSRSSDRSSSSVATQSRGRGGKGRKSVKVEELEEEEKGEQSAAVGRGRGRGRGGKRPGANDIKAEATGEAEKEEDEVMAVSEDSVTSQSSSRGRKRGADVSMLTAESPQPTPKTPRRSLAGQTHKVLFTGVVDEDGEKVVVRLGGGLAKGVGDMTHLVTDKVRRTVKFLCAVARGVPIVTPDWLSKCGKAGSFLSPNAFLVKDVEQEKRFNFSLQEALRVASSQPLLQGYEIHVTPSVKPEPTQMKEIITCCGARFLPKMPSAHKAQTVVVSCEEDRALCERARSLSFPVVSAEFLLTGILQQKVDVQTHTLSLSPTAAVPKPAPRTRGK